MLALHFTGSIQVQTVQPQQKGETEELDGRFCRSAPTLSIIPDPLGPQSFLGAVKGEPSEIGETQSTLQQSVGLEGLARGKAEKLPRKRCCLLKGACPAPSRNKPALGKSITSPPDEQGRLRTENTPPWKTKSLSARRTH